MNSHQFCHGHFAKVYTLTNEEKQMFPYADVVRKQRCNDQFWFARRYYQYRILHLLFPEMFINVVGASCTVTAATSSNWNTADPRSLKKYELSQFSKIAPVPVAHAQYVEHMHEFSDGKRSLCRCEGCIAHRQYHAKHDTVAQAYVLHEKMYPKGIIVPWYDESDYCFSEKNNSLFFFEVDDFDSKKLLEYVQTIDDKAQIKIITRLLERFTLLRNQSKNLMLQGKGELLMQ